MAKAICIQEAQIDKAKGGRRVHEETRFEIVMVVKDSEDRRVQGVRERKALAVA